MFDTVQVQNVWIEYVGTNITATVAAGATVLTLEDDSNFDTSGQVAIDDVVYNYTHVEDSGQITISPGLATAINVTTADPVRVRLYPLLEEKWASAVRVGEAGGEKLRVSHSLQDKLAVGVRDPGEMENVVMVWEENEEGDDGEWVLDDVLARAPLTDGSYIDPDTLPPSTPVAPTVTPDITVFPGPGAAVVSWEAVPGDVYDVYVSTSNAVSPDSTMLHPEGEGVLPSFWARTMPDGSSIPPNSDRYFAIWARNDGGSAPAPSAWVAGHPGVIDPQYLVLTVGTLLANGLFAEAASLINLYVSGDFEANTLTAIGKASFRAPDNELAPNSQLILQNAQTAPATPPSLNKDLPYVDADDTEGTYWMGGYSDGTYLYSVMSVSGVGNLPVFRQPLAGGNGTKIGPISLANLSCSGITKLGSNWYILYYRSGSSHWFVQKFDSSWVAVGAEVDLGANSAMTNCVMGNDGTNILVAYKRGSATAGVSMKTYDTSLALLSTLNLKQADGTTDYSPGSGGYLRTVNKGNFDYGSSRLVLFVENALQVPVFTAAGVYSLGDTWSTPTGVQHLNGTAWDPTAGQFVHLDLNVSKLYKYTKDIWATGDYNANRYVGLTWINGSTETDLGVPGYIDSWKRWRTSIATASIPGGSIGFRAYMGQFPDTTGDTSTDQFATGVVHGLAVNDQVVFDSRGTITGISTGTVYYVQSVPDTTHFKIAATLGGAAINLTGTSGAVRYRKVDRTKFWRVLELNDGTLSGYAADPAVLGSPSLNPPAANGYGAGTAALLKSIALNGDATRSAISLSGDGNWYLDPDKNADDSGWVTFASGVGVAPFAHSTDTVMRYRKVAGRVHLQVEKASNAVYNQSASDGNFPNTALGATGMVPAAARPATTIDFVGVFDDVPVTLRIQTSGNLLVIGGIPHSYANGATLRGLVTYPTVA